jgi:hypothetical protein
MKSLIIAGAVIAVCFILGSILAPQLKKYLTRPNQPDAIKEVAPAIASFVFWLFVVAGVLFALAQSSPGSLDHIPSSIIAYVPKVVVAGVMIIAGKVAGTLLGMTVGRGILKATGQRKPGLERMIAAVVMAFAGLIGVAQLGIDTAVVNLVLAAVLACVSLSAALLVGFGGRDISRHIAAGRYLRGVVHPGWTVKTAGRTGRIVAVRPASMEMQLEDGSIVFIPNSDVLSNHLQVLDATAIPTPEG